MRPWHNATEYESIMDHEAKEEMGFNEAVAQRHGIHPARLNMFLLKQWLQ